MMLVLVGLLVLIFAGRAMQTAPPSKLSHCRTNVGIPGVTESSNVCGGLEDWALCVKDQEGSDCKLEETNGVTFAQIQELMVKYCPVLEEVGECENAEACLQDTKFWDIIAEGNEISETSKTGFWCSLIIELFGCALEDGSCVDDVDKFTAVLEDVKTLCSSGTIQESTLTTVLVLSTAALILPLIFA